MLGPSEESVRHSDFSIFFPLIYMHVILFFFILFLFPFSFQKSKRLKFRIRVTVHWMAFIGCFYVSYAITFLRMRDIQMIDHFLFIFLSKIDQILKLNSFGFEYRLGAQMWMRSPRCAKTSLRTTVRQSPHSAETIVLLCTIRRLCLQSSTIIISLFYSYQTIILNFIFNNLLFWVYLVLCVMNFRNGSAQSCEIYTKSKQSRNSRGRKLYAQARELRKIC